MTLHQDATVFRQLILLAGEHFSMRPSYIEKDYWVTQILQRLSESSYAGNVVFKGGTSLSKGYNLINRFSEDVDVAVIHEGLTGNAVKTLIRNVEKGVVTVSDEGLAVSGDLRFKIEDPENSKGSMFRKSVLTYPVIMPEEQGGISVKRMILEISAFANPFPYEVREIRSLIGQYLETIGRGDVVARYGMEAFRLNVLDYRRTLVEKIVSLTRFSFGEPRQLAQKIRHFYDIYYLMQTEGCREYVGSSAFRTDVASLLEHDQQTFDSPEGWSEKGMSETPLVTQFDALWEAIVPTYETEMASLSFSAIPDAAAVAKVLKGLFAMLGKNNHL